MLARSDDESQTRRTRRAKHTYTIRTNPSPLAILIYILLLLIIILARRRRLDAFTRRRLLLILRLPLPARHRRCRYRPTRRTRTPLRRRAPLLRRCRRRRLRAPLIPLRLLALNLRHLVGRQEAPARSARPAHRVVMSRLVEIRFPPLGRKAQCLLEALTRDAPFQDPVELLRVDVQRALFCSGAGNELGRLRVLWRLCGHRWCCGARDVIKEGLCWGAGRAELRAYAAGVAELLCELVRRARAARGVFLEVDAAHARRGVRETRIRRQEWVTLARSRGGSCHGGGLC